ncbi:MAG: FadR family transcriptional regulator, partial [Firmicutes bacterium]|nr:FadR family transcriptional regulator [Bacillota bacterium]
MGLLDPVDRSKVTKIVIERIKDALISGELRREDQLPPETELAQKLGVGRTSVREALKMLEAIGVVEARRGQGTFVSTGLSPNTIDPLIFALILQGSTGPDLVELRTMFEVGYTEIAIQKATEEDLKEMEKAITALEEAAKEGRADADVDLAFHRAVLKATRNPFIIQIGETVLDLFKASIQKTVHLYYDRAVADHKAIFEAIKQRDTAKAREAIYRSFEVWRDYGV